jgi:MIP family channel proteins
VDKPSYSSRLLAEVIGTFGFFFLGFAGIAAAVDHPGSISSTGVAAGFGLGLALMIFAFGHVSGGHYNPAVSLGLASAGQFPWAEVPGYWVAQLIGGGIAAAVARACFSPAAGRASIDAPAMNVSDTRAFVLEAIGTFLFLLVIATLVSDRRAPWNGVFAPIGIGLYIFAAAVVLGPFSSGSFNPARSIDPAVINWHFDHLAVFVFAPLVGGYVGGLVHRFVRGESGGGEPVSV